MPEPLTMIGVAAGLGTIGVHLARRFFETAKEIFDIVVGFLALVVSLPLMAVCAILVKLSSKGPVLFRQARVGRGGKQFSMLKFRTMYVDVKPVDGVLWTEDDDPRIMPVCRWMRRSHIDELPQLINVVRGEMSIVGPRPERPEIVAELQKICPDFSKRHIVRPGITGLSQIRNGYAASVQGSLEKLKADLQYIEQRKWSSELRIIAQTVPKILGDSKAH